MKGSRALALASIAAALSFAAPARANPDFDRGKELLENLEFKAAAEAFTKALEAGGNDPATTVAIYMHLGEIAASRGEDEAAVDHFRRALSIDLTIKLPKGTSPKVGKPFADARRGIEDPIAASIEVDGDDAVAATLTVSNDTLEMVRSAAVTYVTADGKTSTGLRIKGAETKVPIPANTTGLEIALLDRHDNRLIVLDPVELETKTEDKPPEVIAEPVVEKSAPSRPFITRWYLWGGLAVAAAATGVGFGVATQSALDELDELKMNSTAVEGSDALALEDKARSRALLANISFAAAGALAITAAVFFFTDSDDTPEAKSGVAISPTLTPDGVGVVSTVRW